MAGSLGLLDFGPRQGMKSAFQVHQISGGSFVFFPFQCPQDLILRQAGLLDPAPPPGASSAVLAKLFALFGRDPGA